MPVTLNGNGQVPVQVIQATKSDAFTSTSNSMVDITGMSLNITPTSSSNRILITVSMVVSGDTWIGGPLSFNLVRNSTNLLVGTSGSSINATSGYNAYSSSAGNTQGNFSPVTISFLDSPNTTSSTTYKLQGRIQNSGYSWAINRQILNDSFGFSSTITAMEISG